MFSFWKSLSDLERRMIGAIILFVVALFAIGYHNHRIATVERERDQFQDRLARVQLDAATATHLASDLTRQLQDTATALAKANVALDRRVQDFHESSAMAEQSAEAYLLSMQAKLDAMSDSARRASGGGDSTSVAAAAALSTSDTTAMRVVNGLLAQLRECKVIVADDSTQRARQQKALQFAVDSVASANLNALAAKDKVIGVLHERLDALEPHGWRKVLAEIKDLGQTLALPAAFVGGVIVGTRVK